MSLKLARYRSAIMPNNTANSVVFVGPFTGLSCLQVDTDEGKAACKDLGVEVIPTVQFWKSGQKLWETRGIVELENDLGEGDCPHHHKLQNFRKRLLTCPIHVLQQAVCGPELYQVVAHNYLRKNSVYL